ncbi:MAG: hypothetical protein IPL90_13805 [Holophagales bacterium]|nr:hypothetical protein [Holophagales bacterium]
MRTTITLLALLLALPTAAEEITVDKILAAHGFGASTESILAKVNDPGNTVSVMAASDAEKLRTAGVPESVVSALLAKAPPAMASPATVASGTQPDNPRAVDVVKAVQAGTSEKLIVDQLMQKGVEQRPSLNDLIYLKENKVPEGVIRALMDAPLVAAGMGAGRSAGPAPVPSQVEVDGLVRKTGLWSKNRTGKLVLKADKIEWLDGTNQADSFEMFPAGLKAVRTECLAKPEGKVLPRGRAPDVERFDFTFTDAKAEVGGNESIKALLTGLKALYPKLPIVEKLK